jgi:hypothetical protein
MQFTEKMISRDMGHSVYYLLRSQWNRLTVCLMSCIAAISQTGTNQDNVDDKVAKGRMRPSKGERNGRAKLTEKQGESHDDRIHRQGRELDLRGGGVAHGMCASTGCY